MKTQCLPLLAAALPILCGAPDLKAQPSQFQWAKTIASTTNPDNELAVGLAIDGATNLYVTGWFDGTNDFGGLILTNPNNTGQGIFVAKYNSGGTLQWAQRVGGNAGDWDAGRGVGVDAGGNVYITGGFHGIVDFGGISLAAQQDQEFFLAKYDSAGKVLWARQSAGGGHSAYGTGIAVDRDGTSYCVGYLDGSGLNLGGSSLPNPGDHSTFLVKYDSGGTLQWAQAIVSSNAVYSTKVVIDYSGSICLAGVFEGNVQLGGTNLISAGGKDLFVAKLDPTGALLWVRQAGGEADDTAESGVAVDASNNVFISGAYASNPLIMGGTALTNAGGWDAFVAKYDSTGTLQWARRGGSVGMDWLVNVTADSQGHAYAAGTASSNASFGHFNVNGFGGLDAVVVEYDATGEVLGVQSAGGGGDDIGWNSVVDSAGNLYLDGWFQGTAQFGASALTNAAEWGFFLAQLAPTPTGSNNAPESLVGDVVVATVTNGMYVPLTITFDLDIFSQTGGYGDGMGNYTYRRIDSTSGIIEMAKTTPVSVDGDTSQITLVFSSPTNGTFEGHYLTAGGISNTDYGTFELTGTVNCDPTCTNFTYEYNGAVTITGYIGTNSSVAVPSRIAGLPVTSIGEAAFYWCNSLTNLVIPSTVTNIAGWAFAYCMGLSTVVLPDNVLSIGNWAFSDCASLTNLILPNSLIHLGDAAFVACSAIDHVIIPSNVVFIGSSPFSRCASLTNITVDAGSMSFTAIDGVLFNKTLTTLIQFPPGRAGTFQIPGTVTNIGAGAFCECSGLESVTIPNSVIRIGDDAFSDCSSLTSVVIPNGVISIGSAAFNSCFSLTNILIPASLTSLGNGVFWYCLDLPAITVDAGNPAFCSINGVLFDKGQSTLLQVPGGLHGSYAVPAGVTQIAQGACYHCMSLETITIPGTVTNIGDLAFYNCASLTGLLFKGNAPDIGLDILSYADKATVYYLPSGTGWDLTFDSRPVICWDPRILSTNAAFGVHADRFGFDIAALNGTNALPFVVEACTNPASPVWLALLTNAGSVYFSDKEWTNHPVRFYRLRFP